MKINVGTVGRKWWIVAATAISLLPAGCSPNTSASILSTPPAPATGSATSPAISRATSSVVSTAPTIKGLLGIVPNNANTTKNLVTINLYQQAAKATGVAMPTPGASEKTVAEFFAALSTKHGLVGSELVNELRMYAPDPTKQLGLDASQVYADVSAGQPPTATVGAVGKFDSSAVAAAAKKTSTGLTTPTYDKTTVYRWNEDNQVDLTRANSGLFTQVGGSRRLAFPDSSTMVFGATDSTIHEQLDAATDQAKSLASNADFAAAAAELDAQHVFSAILTAAPPTVGNLGAAVVTGSPSAAGSELAALKAAALAPYRLAGIGVTESGATPTVVIVLVNSDAASALTNATKLTAIVTTGTSIKNNAPWSKVLTVRDIHAAGALTVGTFGTSNPAIWSRLMYARDTLLMHS